MSKKAQNRREEARRRRKLRLRKKISGTGPVPRISVYRSAKYTYVQAISDDQSKTVVGASTREKEVSSKLGELGAAGSTSAKSVAAAKALGLVLGQRLLAQNIERAVFDRNGFLYAGRIQAVAEGLREAGVRV